MAQLVDIQSTQKNLEVSFSKRMSELEAQLQTGGSAKDTIARVAEEFRTFRELMFGMLRLIRQQIAECSRTIDVMETRHRRKALLFVGIEEDAKENCTATILTIVNNTLGLKDISAANLTACHRIGASSQEHRRPILVRFSGLELRSLVWRAKSRLKGGSISVKEFLTRPRQLVFAKARQHFGMRACWTQDGVIIVKITDGSRVKMTTNDDLDMVIKKYPKATAPPSSASGNSTTASTKATSNTKSRKL